MADQRTEQPTKRRLDKARKEGQFAVSREFVSAVQFLLFVWLLGAWCAPFLANVADFFRTMLARAVKMELDRSAVVFLYREALMRILVQPLFLGAFLVAITICAQLGTTKLGVSPQKLMPDFKRLNPFQKLKDLPAQGLAHAGQMLLMLPLFGFAVYRIAADNLQTALSLPAVALQPALLTMFSLYRSLLWKAGLILLLLGTLDFLRQQKRHNKGLRMSKHEVKEEHKESEGNPQIKVKIRRLQRDAARRNMMKEVPTATAVIVNPTHYSVAIRYDMDTMAAPRVVAKGKNYLALRIRQIANDHQVPIIENQPLAQALYKSADVGQEIPPQLYRAVAEILAYLFKLMQPGRR